MGHFNPWKTLWSAIQAWIPHVHARGHPLILVGRVYDKEMHEILHGARVHEVPPLPRSEALEILADTIHCPALADMYVDAAQGDLRRLLCLAREPRPSERDFF